MAIPSKANIFEYWMEWLSKNCFDWGEPCCLSCRKHCGNKYDIRNPKATKKEVIRNWNKVPLKICHIVPKQL